MFKNTLPNKLYWILFLINNQIEAVDTTKRVLNKEKLDNQLTGQASNTSPLMKLRHTTHSSQRVSIKPQHVENMTSMMYNMSLQQDKAKKPFKPQVYQRRGRGQRQKIIKETDQEIMIGRDKVLYEIGAEIIMVGMDTCKTLVETTAEIEVGENLTEVIVVIGVDQEKEAYLQEGIVIGNMVILD